MQATVGLRGQEAEEEEEEEEEGVLEEWSSWSGERERER